MLVKSCYLGVGLLCILIFTVWLVSFVELELNFVGWFVGGLDFVVELAFVFYSVVAENLEEKI